MDITAVRAFFMWCTIINVGLLFLTSLACIFLVDFTYKINSKWFSISRQTFDTVFFSFVALYKLFVIVFNIVPYIALLIIG
jgi:hypothetical protein